MSATLSVATNFVLPDEKVWWFEETWRPIAGKGARRIERIAVKRGDGIAVYENDVGPFDMKRNHVFRAPSYWCYSVAELRELAMRSRENKPMTEPDENVFDVMSQWRRTLEERAARRKHRTVVGPYLRKERS